MTRQDIYSFLMKDVAEECLESVIFTACTAGRFVNLIQIVTKLFVGTNHHASQANRYSIAIVPAIKIGFDSLGIDRDIA